MGPGNHNGAWEPQWVKGLSRGVKGLSTCSRGPKTQWSPRAKGVGRRGVGFTRSYRATTGPRPLMGLGTTMGAQGPQRSLGITNGPGDHKEA